MESKLIQEFTVQCSAGYSTDHVKVDNSVHNANRITRVYGTQNRKGDPVPGGTHRYSRILSCPNDRRVLDEQQLQAAIDSLQRHVATSHPTFNAENREVGNLQSDIHVRAKVQSHRLHKLAIDDVVINFLHFRYQQILAAVPRETDAEIDRVEKRLNVARRRYEGALETLGKISRLDRNTLEDRIDNCSIE